VSCFTLGPAARAYAGDVTERSVMVVVVLPSPSWAFPPSTRPRRAPPAGPFCEKVSRARSAAPQGRSRPSSRAMGVRCRHRSRVYPRSAFKCAQVGYTRLAWTATVPHGPGSAVHRYERFHVRLRRAMALHRIRDTGVNLAP